MKQVFNVSVEKKDMMMSRYVVIMENGKKYYSDYVTNNIMQEDLSHKLSTVSSSSIEMSKYDYYNKRIHDIIDSLKVKSAKLGEQING